MPIRRRVTARKQPTQARSRDTVEVLVQATARVLLRDGYEGCTTNRVADEAGVSIGSLYQYYPNKEALVVAVMERHHQHLREALGRRLAELGGATLEVAAREMVRAMLELMRLEPRLHRVLLEQVPRIGALRRLHELHGLYQPMIAGWLEAHAEQLPGVAPAADAYVLVAACEGVVTRALLERPTWFEEGQLEASLVRLVLAYLGTARAPQSGRSRLAG